MEAYQAAAQWGARCMEISVGMTSDGVLICMHDQTYDRTTNLSGVVSQLPSTVLRNARVTIPHLGPAWMTEPLPRVPLFENVLRTFGRKAVLCVEAKTDDAYPAIVNLVERYGLTKSVMIKAHHTSKRIEQAKRAGYPVFGYLGSAAEATTRASPSWRTD